MIASKDCKKLVKHFEGLRLTAYQCSANVWTLGWGHTRGVEQGDYIDQDQAETWLDDDLHSCAKDIHRLVNVPLEQHQFDALSSWVFNLGGTNLKESTMLKVINGDIDGDIVFEMKRWNKSGGQILPGLIKRRDAEAEMWLGLGFNP